MSEPRSVPKQECTCGENGSGWHDVSCPAKRNPTSKKRSFERVPITPANTPTLADYDAALVEIEQLRAALSTAIEGHKVWESVYGSSPTSRAHLSELESALSGYSSAPETPRCNCAEGECHGPDVAQAYGHLCKAECPVETKKNWTVWQCLEHGRMFAAHAGCSHCREGRPALDPVCVKCERKFSEHKTVISHDFTHRPFTEETSINLDEELRKRDLALKAPVNCDCPNGSYGKKHRADCPLNGSADSGKP